MGQKVNPVGFRVGRFYPWRSRWYIDGVKYREYLLEDIQIRKILMDQLKLAGVVDVEIERLPKSMEIGVYVSRPGVVIGRGGSGLEEVKKIVKSVIEKEREGATKQMKIDIKVIEVKNPELSAHLVASRIASEIERRMPYRRVVNRALDRVMQAGAKGIKIVLSGRIAGADISRREKFHRGSVPTQTLREFIDYAEAAALQKKGYVGVKVYIHKNPEQA